MDRASLRGLSESLGYLASTTNMIIVDLTAAVVGTPRAFARDLLAPPACSSEPGSACSCWAPPPS